MSGADHTSDQPRWSVLDVVESLGAAVYGPVGDDAELAGMRIGEAGPAAGVAIDTRELRPGDLFVALQGTRSHGIEHAAEAFDRGAIAVLAGTDLEVPDDRWEELLGAAADHGPVLVATDCDGVTALGRLARAWRRRSSFRVVGITGSSGKTGTKDLLAALLRRAGVEVVASHANWNNEIGVPLTLLAGGPGTDVVICEMGMRGSGQIAWLCDVADPDIGIVTTAGTAHLELLGSREAIVAAKAEILAGTWKGGVGIFPGVQPELVDAAGDVPDRLLPFGVGEDEADGAAILVTSLARTSAGIAGTIDLMGTELEFALPVHGLHQARNLAAAAGALVVLRGSAQLLAADALQLVGDDRVRLTGGRGDRVALADGGVVIDDSYNANPESVRAALEELAAVDGARRVAVLGRMAELGPDSPALHAEVGGHAAALTTIDELVVVGSGNEARALATAWQGGRGSAPRTYADVDVAVAAVGEWRRPGDVVLVKASNSSGLGRLADALVEGRRVEPGDAGGGAGS
jgi:UDP-N-acetylmuramoyl-tripeptide--D-alanyl-D-alanine ligase